MRKLGSKLQDLENKIKDNLHSTGLFSRIKIKRGDLTDPENLPYFEYKLKEENNNAEKYLEIINDMISKSLDANFPGFSIKSDRKDTERQNQRPYKAKIIVQPGIKIYDEEEQKYKIFNCINETILEYLRIRI